jgi:hypothetical protein
LAKVIYEYKQSKVPTKPRAPKEKKSVSVPKKTPAKADVILCYYLTQARGETDKKRCPRKAGEDLTRLCAELNSDIPVCSHHYNSGPIKLENVYRDSEGDTGTLSDADVGNEGVVEGEAMTIEAMEDDIVDDIVPDGDTDGDAV